ncbi:MAG: YbjN domain-containing protein, partial [Pseudomonadota bacterium]
MFAEALSSSVGAFDPLECVEQYANRADIPIRRVDDTELHLSIDGDGRDALLWFVWRPEFQTVQMGAALDLRASPRRTSAVARLIALVSTSTF